MDMLAEEVQDINDPIYQMQRDAFTIHKETLSDFKVIGKGLCVCLSVCHCVFVPVFLDVYMQCIKSMYSPMYFLSIIKMRNIVCP